MTIEEVIDIIKVAKAEVEWNYPLDYTIAFEKVIEILEKQVPMKPYKICEGLYHCEACGTVVCGTGKLCDEYCDHCGQRIDWSEGDE